MILERLKGERFSRVLPLWVDYPVVLIGGGPSVTPEDVELVRQARESDAARVIAINDSYLLAPWADLHYAADAKWHRWHTEGIPKPLLGLTAEQVREKWGAFAGTRCSIQGVEEYVPDAVHLLRNAAWPYHSLGLSLDPGALVTGRHGGFQALNLAVLAGAKTILLLGYDGRPAKNGMTHWHGEHPKPTSPAIYEEIRRSFSAAEGELAKAGVRVLNCSPGTGIDSFPKMAIADAIKVPA